VVFLTVYRKTVGQYLALGHSRLLSNLYVFTVHDHSVSFHGAVGTNEPVGVAVTVPASYSNVLRSILG